MRKPLRWLLLFTIVHFFGIMQMQCCCSLTNLKRINNLIIHKFEYPSLVRVDGAGPRHYITPTGENLPSVTTILDKTKSEEKKQILQDWKDSVGEKRSKEIVTEAANRGTRMHAYLERYIAGETLKEKVANPYAQESLDMAKTVIKTGFVNVDEFWGSEVQLYFPRVYAGTTDCVGVHNNIPSIIDFKQTNKPKKREYIEDYFLQLCLYATAHNELYGTKIQRGVIMMCDPTCVYQEFVIEGSEWKYYEGIMWDRLIQYYEQLEKS